MSEFKEVSLGFAEFVSQLIQETFDAILSSQNYQLEKFAELESKLNLPNKLYAQYYITSEQIDEKTVEFFGFPIQKQMIVDQELNLFLKENFESDTNFVLNNKLTNEGFDILIDFITNIIAEEQKSMIRTLLNNSNAVSLMVDSGEIRAKLELSNLYTQEGTTEKFKSTAQKLEKRLPTGITKDSMTKAKLPLPTYRQKVDVIDFKDVQTGKTTVLIDKNKLENIDTSNFQIPNVRLSVQPTKMTETSNLYSEINIKFRTS